MGLVISLIIIGLIFIFAEVLLIPGVGVVGILGLLSMGGSCFYAFYELGTTAGIIVSIVNAVLIILLMIWVLRARTWKRMSLETNIDSKAVVPDVAVSVGDVGNTLTRLAPMGMARFGDSSIEVTSSEGIIDNGSKVVVTAVEGIKIFVAPCTDGN